MFTLWLLSTLSKNAQGTNPRPKKAHPGFWFFLGMLCSPIVAIFDLAKPNWKR